MGWYTPLRSSSLKAVHVFARKVIPPMGTVTDKNVDTELEAIQRIRRGGTHPNIITISNTQRIGQREIFVTYIDMALCDMNLDEYIYGDKCHLATHMKTLFLAIANEPASPSPSPEFNYSLDIVLQITSGLRHIHNLSVTHRDLKPPNGVST